MAPRPPPPRRLLAAAAAAAALSSANGAVVGRFGADSTCSGRPASTYKVFANSCYFESKEWGTTAAGWLFNLGSAPIVFSSAVASCAPGTLTLSRWDSSAFPYTTGACAASSSSSLSSVVLALDACVADPGDLDAPAGPNFVKLLDDSCLGGPLDEFFNLKIFYSATCAAAGLAFQSTYYSGASGACEETTVPQFLVATSYARYNLTYSNANGGSFAAKWFSSADEGCASAPIGTFQLGEEQCTPIFNGVGGALLTRPPPFPSSVTLPSPSPTPSASSSPLPRGGGALASGAPGAQTTAAAAAAVGAAAALVAAATAALAS
jgi:hypothetical protein